MTTKTIEEMGKDWDLLWGLAPIGSLKYKRGQEIKKWLLKQLAEAEKKGYEKAKKDIKEVGSKTITICKAYMEDHTITPTEFSIKIDSLTPPEDTEGKV